ncbi:MAG: N-6 DNA methylase, partial [Promethearchaeota archaeon]
LAKIIGKYKTRYNKDLDWIILLEKDGISYLSGQGEIFSTVKYPEKKENLIKLLTSLIACIDIRAAFNGETFEAQFGPYSPFFAKALFFMKKYLNEHKVELEVIRGEWERYFEKVYKKEDLDEELLIKHSYLSLIIKNVLFCKYLPEKVVENASSFVELTELLEKKGVELFFYDFYTWANNIIELKEDIFKALDGAIYESDDIFRVIYQDMVSPSTRYALGEFYTPPELVQLIMDDLFEFDVIFLDPTCGSGTFLVEIINRIKNSEKKLNDKIKAISKVYGFDVNPIAVLVAKANLLLHLEDLNIDKIPINIFLTDSIKIIEKNPQTNMIWGSYLTFPLGSVGELYINTKFFQKPTKEDPFDYLNEFIKYLQFIDEQMTKNVRINVIINNFDKEYKDCWLDKNIPNCSNTYRDNIHNIISILGNLEKKNQNHIWLYLLYNSIGAYLLRDSVDIIVGNPPWLTYKDIKSNEYKKEIDNLSQILKLKPSNIAHIELSILFFKFCSLKFLKKGGKICLLMNQTIIRGETFEKFRSFQGFSNIKIWKFLDPTFKIAHIALFGKKESLNYLPSPIFPITLIKGNHLTGYEKLNTENYIPTYIKKVNNQRLIGELIPESEKEDTLKIRTSVYKASFYDGANIIPNLFLLINVKETKEGSEIVKITPNPKYYSSATEKWRFFPFLESEIKNIYIFDTIKGGNICPFTITNPNKTFLPITKKLKFDENMDEKSKKHYLKLNKLFIKHHTGRSKTYWDYINHNSQLTMQYGSKYKVVYNKDGSVIKAALISSSILVDNSVIFYKTDNENEGYYLIGILNSPLITKNIQKRGGTGYKGSTRHIQQLPLDYPIPRFQNIELHLKISNLAKECEKF